MGDILARKMTRQEAGEWMMVIGDALEEMGENNLFYGAGVVRQIGNYLLGAIGRMEPRLGKVEGHPAVLGTGRFPVAFVNADGSSFTVRMEDFPQRYVVVKNSDPGVASFQNAFLAFLSRILSRTRF